MKFTLIITMCFLGMVNIASANELMPCLKGSLNKIVGDTGVFADNCFSRHSHRPSKANGSIQFDVDLDGVMERFETREHFQYIFKKTDKGYKYLGLIGMESNLFAVLKPRIQAKPIVYVAKQYGWNEDDRRVMNWYVQTYEYQDNHFKQTNLITVAGTDKLFGLLFPHLAQEETK